MKEARTLTQSQTLSYPQPYPTLPSRHTTEPSHYRAVTGFIIEAEKGVRMDPEKVKAIQDWESPKTVKEVRGFLGFANFYRRFIKNFSAVASPLITLTKKNVPFVWSTAAEDAFQLLKRMFVTAPILMQFDPSRETVVETDSSGYVVGGVLMQYDENGTLRPCAYFSQQNTPTESNYEIYDKELLAIVKCLRTWDSELRSLHHFEVVTDHQNLTYFTKTRKLKERQMRWAEELSRFNFTIRYRPAREGTMPDVLSRRDQDMPVGADDRYAHREAVLLRPEMIKGFHASSLRLNRLALARVTTPADISPASDGDDHSSVASTAPDATNRPNARTSPTVHQSLISF